jgi:YfiH family protein
MSLIFYTILNGTRAKHAFFTRTGGVSTGIYASLNCGLGSNDDRASVIANRARALAALEMQADALNTVHQRHTDTVVTVDGPWGGDPPVADAMVTRRPGRALGILTADCAPILMVDPQARVIGAAHAGWRGALAGIVERTVEAMATLGAEPRRIRAGVGPCIGQESYQVGPEFVATFLAAEAANESFFGAADGDGKRHFDLAGYVAGRLRRAGVGTIDAAPPDTCADETRFFSFRRSTLRREADYGRQLSLIALEGS